MFAQVHILKVRSVNLQDIHAPGRLLSFKISAPKRWDYYLINWDINKSQWSQEQGKNACYEHYYLTPY